MWTGTSTGLGTKAHSAGCSRREPAAALVCLPFLGIAWYTAPREDKDKPAMSRATRALDCSDFPTQAAALACHECYIHLGYGDIHRLDGDNDGKACEALP